MNACTLERILGRMDGKPDYGNPYLFTGRRVDILDNCSLTIQYNRNRYYDYYTGRWTTHDGLGITPNAQRPNVSRLLLQYRYSLSLYEYAKSKPIRFTDAYGMKIKIPWFKDCDAWQNDGDVSLPKVTERGCRLVSPGSMPPTFPGLDLIVEILALVLPTNVVCDMYMNRGVSEGQLCKCTWWVYRPCKRACCRKYYSPKSFWKWGCVGTKVWTQKRKRYIRVIWTFGEAYYPSYSPRKLKCGCRNPKNIKSQEYLNKRYNCG